MFSVFWITRFFCVTGGFGRRKGPNLPDVVRMDPELPAVAVGLPWDIISNDSRALAFYTSGAGQERLRSEGAATEVGGGKVLSLQHYIEATKFDA